MTKRISAYLLSIAAVISGGVLGNVGCGSDDSVTLYDPNGPSLGGDGGADGRPVGEACGQALTIAETAPLDIVFLVDRSDTMEGQKWNAASHAVLEFINQGFPSPTRIGLNLSPYPYHGDVLGDQNNTNYHTCDYRLYSDFETPIGPAEDATQRAALESAFANAVLPDGLTGFGYNTPLYASLLGTYMATAKLQQQNPDHQVLLIVVGNGAVTACDQYPASQTSAAALSDLAKAALDQTKVRTFAIATSGTALTLLQNISEAGGGAAFEILQNTTDDMFYQLQRIKAVGIGCTLELPPAPLGREIAPDSVTVDLTSGAGDDRLLSLAAGFAECASDASFFLDDPAAPTRATLCPAACAALKADPTTRALVSFQCKQGVK